MLISNIQPNLCVYWQISSKKMEQLTLYIAHIQLTLVYMFWCLLNFVRKLICCWSIVAVQYTCTLFAAGENVLMMHENSVALYKYWQKIFASNILYEHNMLLHIAYFPLKQAPTPRKQNQNTKQQHLYGLNIQYHQSDNTLQRPNQY